MKIILFTIILAGFSLPTGIWAATYYVSGSAGSDANPGTSASPWKTLAKANSVLRSGDTVYIKAGTYAETILPATSGAAGQYITYKNFASDAVQIGGTMNRAADLTNKSYIRIEGLQFTRTNDCWIQMQGGGHHQIIHCNFTSTGEMGWAGIMITSSDYNLVSDCSLSTSCKPKDLLDIYGGHYNRIENNYFGNAGHTAMALHEETGTQYNVIRNNIFQNLYHSNLNPYAGGDYSLVENNKFLDAGDACGLDDCPQNPCGSDIDRSRPKNDHGGTQIGANYIIYRKNVLINNGRFSFQSADAQIKSIQNRVYHNTFFKNYYNWYTNCSGPNPLSDNVAINNIFYDGIERNISFNSSGETANNKFIRNAIHGTALVRYQLVSGLEEIESAFPALWFDNYYADPNFVDPANRDLHLKNGSLLINQAAWLTTVTSPAGSGNTFKVADARYFMDGWGIIEGDQIQLEDQTLPVRITAVDYDTNTLTLERSITWKAGAGVSLPYFDSAPDIGAYEYSGQTPLTPLAPRGLTVK